MKKESQPKKSVTEKRLQQKGVYDQMISIPLDEFRVSMNEHGWTRISGWLMNTATMRKLIGRQGEYSYRVKSIRVHLELEENEI